MSLSVQSGDVASTDVDDRKSINGSVVRADNGRQREAVRIQLIVMQMKKYFFEWMIEVKEFIFRPLGTCFTTYS